MTGNTDQTAEELAHPDAQELLRTEPLARLAYNGADGAPRVIPIGFWWTGDRVVVCTSDTAPKVRALAARPPVALTIDGAGASQTLQLRGEAQIEIVDGIPEEYLASSFKGIPDEDQRRQFEASVRSTYARMARISIEPRWARFYDFGAGRLPGFMTKLISG
ncbi:MAG TPA: pyridoxamine 5'-phosphate oxidase family protein [Streptosporangiaceae bacterium]|jgi:hypothetical protein|nr:pyridoxamine 5'-phosphate oxidase family protein [Streptosporangiaceae bacterium]